MAQLVGNTGRLQRELLLLSRHFKEFDNPLMETWEADILTRLIEVSHVRQTSKLPEGVSIGEMNTAERENLSLAYSNAARRVQPRTLSKLGLGDKYHQAIQRYSEVSTNPLVMTPECNQPQHLPFIVLSCIDCCVSEPESIPNRDSFRQVAGRREAEQTGKVCVLGKALSHLLRSNRVRKRKYLLKRLFRFDLSFSRLVSLFSGRQGKGKSGFGDKGSGQGD